MSAKRYPARIYRPHGIKQRRHFNGKLIGCTETVFAMFVDAVTFGGVRLTEGKVRSMSNEPIPDKDSPGLNLSQMDAIAAKLGLIYENRTNKGDSWADVVAKLNANRRVQISLWRGFNHSELVQAIRARPGGAAGLEVLKIDPLVGRSVWVVDNDIQAEAKAFSNRNGFSGYTYAYSKILPFVAVGAK